MINFKESFDSFNFKIPSVPTKTGIIETALLAILLIDYLSTIAQKTYIYIMNRMTLIVIDRFRVK